MQELVDFAVHLAGVATQVIMPYHRASISVDAKADGSPVTIADRKAEEAMRAMIEREYPEHGILGEEFPFHQPDAEYRWTLDPIDGTKNFVAGSFFFGTLISLMKGDEPILGVLTQPVANQVLVGAGGKTLLNDEPVSVRSCTRIEDAWMLASTHTSVDRYHNADAYEALVNRAHIYRTWGDCHGYYLLATGCADIMIDPVMQIWDLAPMIPIIEGAGGMITDWYGNPAIGGQGAVATAGPLHAAVIHALAG
jgi:histidinol phosphatase-like enzyme (inositol monophosphatase family)